MKKPTRKSTGEWARELSKIYAELESRPVARSCVGRTTCCQFAVTGAVPNVTLPEIEFLRRGIKVSGRKSAPPPVGGACPLLNAQTGKCISYSHRPFGCRTHFCTAAGGKIPRKDVIDLIRRIEDLDRAMNGKGPGPLDRTPL